MKNFMKLQTFSVRGQGGFNPILNLLWVFFSIKKVIKILKPGFCKIFSQHYLVLDIGKIDEAGRSDLKVTKNYLVLREGMGARE